MFISVLLEVETEIVQALPGKSALGVRPDGFAHRLSERQ
jgi:hypothetical protein